MVSRLPDGSGFVHHRYRQLPPDTPPAPRRHDSATYPHRLGRPDDVLVLARGHNDRIVMAPPDRPFVPLPAGSDWMIAVISHSSPAGQVVAPRRSAMRRPVRPHDR